jgi:competence protein ComEA
MIGLTPQETRILTFLVAALIIGSALSLYQHRHALPPVELVVGSQSQSGQANLIDSTSSRSLSDSTREKVDINVATQAELQSLPGIGPSLAQRIVDYRQAHGPFSSPEEITQVRGIGPKTYQKICPLITAGSRPAGEQN